MPSVTGEQFYVVLGALAMLGAVAIGLKRIRGEVVEVARVEAAAVAATLIELHVTEKHAPVLKILTDIQIAIARVEATLATRQVALGDRVSTIEEHCRDAVAMGHCPPIREPR